MVCAANSTNVRLRCMVGRLAMVVVWHLLWEDHKQNVFNDQKVYKMCILQKYVLCICLCVCVFDVCCFTVWILNVILINDDKKVQTAKYIILNFLTGSWKFWRCLYKKKLDSCWYISMLYWQWTWNTWFNIWINPLIGRWWKVVEKIFLGAHIK
jgi:hypothetical protein